MLNLGRSPHGEAAVYESLTAVTQELYQFVSKIQKPDLNDHTWVRAMQTRCQELSERVAAVREDLASRQKALSLSLEDVLEGLQAYLTELQGSPNAVRLKQQFQSLSHSYEKLVLENRRLKAKTMGYKGSYTHLKPSNYYRNVFHVFMGLSAVISYQFLFTYAQCMMIMAVVLTAATVMEITRRVSPRWNAILVDRVFGPISRPKERHHTNSATYYALSATLVMVLFPKPAAVIGVLVLALGDPAAALAGKRWGRKKIWNEKSEVGALAFFAVGASIPFLHSVLTDTPSNLVSRLLLSLSVGLVGTAAELFGEVWDDNFTIPILCGGVAAFWY